MRMAITILSFVGAVGIASCQSAGAVAINAATMKEAASAASTVQQARFYGTALGTTSLNATAKWSSARMCAAASIVGDGKLRRSDLSPRSARSHAPAAPVVTRDGNRTNITVTVVTETPRVTGILSSGGRRCQTCQG
jgi:hypothetical protein